MGSQPSGGASALSDTSTECPTAAPGVLPSRREVFFRVVRAVRSSARRRWQGSRTVMRPAERSCIVWKGFRARIRATSLKLGRTFEPQGRSRVRCPPEDLDQELNIGNKLISVRPRDHSHYVWLQAGSRGRYLRATDKRRRLSGGLTPALVSPKYSPVSPLDTSGSEMGSPKTGEDTAEAPEPYTGGCAVPRPGILAVRCPFWGAFGAREIP